MSSHIVGTSAIPGTFVSSCTPSASNDAAMSLSTEFFAPGRLTRPVRGPLRWATIRSMIRPVCPDRRTCSGIAPLRSPAVATLRRRWVATDGELGEWLASPRDDLVREVAAGHGVYVQDHGPFLRYERRLVPVDGGAL